MAFTSDLPPLLSGVLALAVVLVLVWIGGRIAPHLVAPDWLRLRPYRGVGTRLARLETLVLGPRHRLHLIRCDGRDVLLLTGGPQDLVVGWLPRDAA
jgi:flagellar protein FliO/FliZ